MPPAQRAIPRARVHRLLAGGDRGSSSTELALATPLLVAILLFVVLCGRLVTTHMDLDAAASSAARSASIARSDSAARAEAERTARETLAARGMTCRQVDVTVTGRLSPGGAVTVRVTCSVPLSDLALLKVPGTRTVESSSTSPIDRWRAGAP